MAKKTEAELDAMVEELCEILIMLPEDQRAEILKPLHEKFKELKSDYKVMH